MTDDKRLKDQIQKTYRQIDVNTRQQKPIKKFNSHMIIVHYRKHAKNSQYIFSPWRSNDCDQKRYLNFLAKRVIPFLKVGCAYNLRRTVYLFSFFFFFIITNRNIFILYAQMK